MPTMTKERRKRPSKATIEAAKKILQHYDRWLWGNDYNGKLAAVQLKSHTGFDLPGRTWIRLAKDACVFWRKGEKQGKLPGRRDFTAQEWWVMTVWLRANASSIKPDDTYSSVARRMHVDGKPASTHAVRVILEETLGMHLDNEPGPSPIRKVE